MSENKWYLKEPCSHTVYEVNHIAPLYVAAPDMCPWCLKKELEEQARLLGMSGEREAKLLAEIEFLKQELVSDPTHINCGIFEENQRKKIESKDALLHEQAKVIEIYREALTVIADWKFHQPECGCGISASQALESAQKELMK